MTAEGDATVAEQAVLGLTHHEDRTAGIAHLAVRDAGTVSIARRIGRWRTAYLALSGLPIDVPTALDWGLVDEIAG